jgi:hypothetical protein
LFRSYLDRICVHLPTVIDVVITDLDIYRSASVFIREHGE